MKTASDIMSWRPFIYAKSHKEHHKDCKTRNCNWRIIRDWYKQFRRSLARWRSLDSLFGHVSSQRSEQMMLRRVSMGLT